jgi:hypothetical protein
VSKPTRLKTSDVLKTFRVLLATCVKLHGHNGALVLTRAAMEAAGDGTLKVTDRPDGAIVLEIRKASRMIRAH